MLLLVSVVCFSERIVRFGSREGVWGKRGEAKVEEGERGEKREKKNKNSKLIFKKMEKKSTL